MTEVIESVPVPKPNWYWTSDIPDILWGRNHEQNHGHRKRRDHNDFGTTYIGFRDFCSEIGMRLCTFEEYCPSEDY